MDQDKKQQATLATPRETASPLCGHDRQESLLLQYIREGRVPHAVIFAGPSGIGKASMAFRVVRYLLADERERSEGNSLCISADSPAFRQVASSGHPDLITIAKPDDKNNIPVDEARKIAPFLRMTSSRGGWRAAIVDDADTMNRNAQNALLKILEEPPEKTLLVLVAHRPGAIVPTIRSRCRVVNFSPLNTQDMREVVGRSRSFAELDARTQNDLIEISGGSPGRALSYLENGSLEVFENAMRIISAYPDIDWVEVHKLADLLASQGMERGYHDFQHIMIERLQTGLKDRITGRESETASLFGDYALADMTKICDNLEQHFTRADSANLDKRQTVLGTFMILGNAERK